MQVIGYFILLLLALYFLFIKPYLMARNIEIEVEDIRFSFERGLSFKSFLLYVPLEEKTIHVFVGNGAIRPWDIKAGELSFIEVSKAPPSDKPFDYDFGPLVKFASRLNLRVDKLYISTNQVLNGESLTLFIPTIELKTGRIYSTKWAQVYRIHHKDISSIEVFLNKAHIEEKNLILERAQVKSDLYNLSLSGIWKGKEGTFQAEGYIEPIEKESFSLEKTNIKLSGSLSYTQINARFSGYSELLDIKNRKEFRSLNLEGEYLWEWKGKNQLKGVITDGFTNVEVDYSLSDGILRAVFRGFPVDQRLLGINQRLSTIASGQLELNLERKLLKLQAYSPIAEFEAQKIMGVSFRLTLNYEGISRGSLELSVAQPFLLSLGGSFYAKDFTGSVSLTGYKLKQEDVSAVVSYDGSLRIQQGEALSYGKGRLENLILKELSLGSASYDLFLEKGSYTINLVGKGYSLSGGGSIKDKNFSGSLNFNGMNLSHAYFNANSINGSMDVSFEGEEASVVGKLEGKLSRENFTSWITVSFNVKKRGQQMDANFNGGLKETKILQFSYEKGSFEGKVDGERVLFSFNLQERLTGRGSYNYKNTSYSLDGFIKHTQGALSVASKYRLSGKGKDLTLEASGEGKYKNMNFPLNASLSMKEGVIDGHLKGFTLKEGVIAFKVPNVRVYGKEEQGNIDAEPLYISIGQETLSRVDFKRGEYKDKKVSLKGTMHGALEGWLEFSYDDGPKVLSEGVLDLGRIFSVIKSRVLADAEGKLSYRLSYKDTLDFRLTSDMITLRSRYIAVPLSGGLYLSFKDDNLSGFLRLTDSSKAFIIANLTGNSKLAKLNFEASRLPLIYRSDSVRTNILLSGIGNIDFDSKNINIAGDFYTSGVLNLQRGKGKAGESPEDYKRVNLNISLASSEPLRLNLPEGFAYADISAKIKGSLYEPEYVVNTSLKGGVLKYFERTFYVRKGELTFTRKENQMDVTITTPTSDYTIIIDIKGNPQYPKAIVRAEPPRDTREVLTTLILGGAQTDSLIPLGSALMNQIPQLGDLIEGTNRMTGLDVKVQISPSVSPTGEVGINAVISKDVGQRLSIEHRQSTLKNPKETYTGGDIKLTPSTSIGGRYYSDKSREVRVRLKRKFDF